MAHGFIPARFRRVGVVARGSYAPARHRRSLGDDISDALNISDTSFDVATTPPPPDVVAQANAAAASAPPDEFYAPGKVFYAPAPAPTPAAPAAPSGPGFFSSLVSGVGSFLTGAENTAIQLVKAGAFVPPPSASPAQVRAAQAAGITLPGSTRAPASSFSLGSLMSGSLPLYLVGGVAVYALAKNLMRPSYR